MIDVHYKGRMGNNMFQYCLGRILAEKFGFALSATPIPGFPRTFVKVDGERCEAPEKTLTGQRIDLDSILNGVPQKYVLDGWFQCYEYYRPYRDQIREWLEFDPAIQAPLVAPNEVVVNVRRTDYILLNWALPFSFYERALTQLMPDGGKIWIVTDDRRDPFFKKFARWKPKFFSGTPHEQLLFMAKAKRLIMSQSTFSWWPTFLGNPEEVICPKSSFGAWSKFGGEASDVNLIESDRFICVECHEPYQPTPREKRHQKRRALWRRIILSINKRTRLSLPEPPM
jgi:hypothetical protein